MASVSGGPLALSPRFASYKLGDYFDEMFEAGGQPRPAYRPLFARLLDLPADDLRRRERTERRRGSLAGVLQDRPPRARAGRELDRAPQSGRVNRRRSAPATAAVKGPATVLLRDPVQCDVNDLCRSEGNRHIQ